MSVYGCVTGNGRDRGSGVPEHGGVRGTGRRGTRRLVLSISKAHGGGVLKAGNQAAGFRLRLVDRSTRRRRMRRVASAVIVAAVAVLASSATSLATSTTFTGHVDAAGTISQVWSINVTDTNSPITASLDWTTTSANLNLFLTAPGSSTIVAQSATMNRPETINYQPTVTGTYKLRVKAVTGASDYTLSTTYNTDTSGGGPTPVPTGPTTDWPMWHYDSYHLGVSADNTIGAS